MYNKYGDDMNDSYFYKCIRPILYAFIKLYKPTYIGLNNIPRDDNFILVGNHTSYFDPLLVASTTKKCVHFLAKNSLYKGIKKPLFKALGIIPVDRSIKDKNALNSAINYLNNGFIVGIFPEGTINRTDDIIMPFKYGAVKMAKETGVKIVPFAIKNEYKFLKKSVIINIGKPYLVKDELVDENEKLMKKVILLLDEKDDV